MLNSIGKPKGKRKEKERLRQCKKIIWQGIKKVYNAFPLSRTTTQKVKLKQFYKSSLKTSTDNLCGPSEEGLKKQRSVEVQLKECTGWRNTKANQNLYIRRVWSWLRLNAGGRPNTCKSNGNIREACFSWWRVADGWVIFGKLPDRGGQQLETTANTAYSLRVKEAIRYQMCPNGIS